MGSILALFAVAIVANLLRGIFHYFRTMYTCPKCGCVGYTTVTHLHNQCEAGAGGDRVVVDLLPVRASVRKCINPDCDHEYTLERKW